jgi:hypothetical protein
VAAESAIGPSREPIPIFDGQTLKGWSQFENSTISFSPNSILDPVELGKRLQDRANPTSVFLYSLLSDAVKQQMAADQSGDADHKALSSALAKYFNEQVAAPSLDAPGRFDLKAIRPETREPLAKNPRGVELMRLNKLLIESAIRRNWRRAYPKGGSSRTAPWRALEADVGSSTARGTMRDFGSSSPCATSPESRITKRAW